MGVWPFFFMEAAALFVFTPYEAAVWLRGRRDRATPAPESPSPASDPDRDRPSSYPALGSWRAALLVALIGVQWAPIFLRHGVYPFLSNAMFSGSFKGGELMVGGARILIEGGAADREIPPEEAASIRSQRWNELVFEQYLSPYKDHRRFAAARPPFCETLLHEVDTYADPGAARMSIWMDYFNVGEQGMRTMKLAECHAPGASSDGPGRQSALDSEHAPRTPPLF
jgi:hypothetical protein